MAKLGSIGQTIGKGTPPPPPDYAAAAQAQGAANLDAAIASSNLNNPNVNNPYGTTTYTPGATPSDRPTINQTFSPEQQALYDQGNKNQQALGDLGAQGISAAQGVIGTGVDFSGMPTTGSYDDTRKKVINAYMGRADEDYGKQTDQNNSNLIAAGIRPGTKAYGDAQQMIERSHNDARNQAEISGGNAASQAFTMDNQRRQQAMSEYLAQRQVPLNEITALMSGSQVSNPFSMPGYAQNANMAPAPTYQATNDLANYNTDVWNAQEQMKAQTRNGLMKLGSAGMMGGMG